MLNGPRITHIFVECHRASVVLAAMATQALPLLGGESPITWAGSLTQEAQLDGSVRPWRLPHEDASLSLYDDNRCACRLVLATMHADVDHFRPRDLKIIFKMFPASLATEASAGTFRGTGPCSGVETPLAASERLALPYGRCDASEAAGWYPMCASECGTLRLLSS
jgi:hypothetical protein